MIKIILISLLLASSVNCIEKSYKYMDIPGSLAPMHGDSSPLGELKLLLKEPSLVHGSREDDILLSLTHHAKQYYYQARDAYPESQKKQAEFINDQFKLTKKQLEHLEDKKKKLKSDQKEKLEQVELDLTVHQLDACALHNALMVIKGKALFRA